MTPLENQSGDLFAANDNEAGKVCTKCGVWKVVDEYNKKKNGKFGLNSECRECQRTTNAFYYKKDGFAKRYKKVKEYRDANPDKKKQWDARYYEQHKDRVKESQKKWRETDPLAKEKRRALDQKWREKNPDKVKAKTKKSQAKRNQKADVRIHNSVSRAMRSGLAKGGKEGKTTFDILGYSRDELMRHLECQFQPGMSWENYGLHGWHIDHIIPKSLFNFKTKEDIDFKRCWALNNLQPMWATDNRQKHALYEKQFQPSLALAVPANDNKESVNDAA